MSKYTEAELKLKDACLDWGNHYLSTCVLDRKQEDRSIQFDKWWAERNKPVKKKIIDLQPLIESGIDCEFSDDGKDWGTIGSVVPFLLDNTMPYKRKKGVVGGHCCRPRMNHKMCHDGSRPTYGFIVKVYFVNGSMKNHVHTSTSGIYWDQIIAIEYLDVEYGYTYPWEQL